MLSLETPVGITAVAAKRIAADTMQLKLSSTDLTLIMLMC